jgi:Periplasmic copper-binding protein (NosD)
MTGHPVTASNVGRVIVAAFLLLAAAACTTVSPTASTYSGSGGTARSSQIEDNGPTDCGGRTVTTVSTVTELQQALGSAQPGATIVLQAGVYQGNFVAATSGTSAAPITLCGDRDAVLQGMSITTGYTLYLDRVSWWKLEGFSVEGGQKGVMADGATHDLIYGLFVHGTGDEGIHLRSFSSYNVVSHNIVRDTGRNVQFFGEGIYVGSANKNWCKYTGCHPDESNDNVIEDNNITDTTAENIDIKEGTTAGVIKGNAFNGTGMVESAATAWVNVKGNSWTIEDNTGVDTIDNGFAVHQVYPGWGIGNIFRDNTATIAGDGYGIYVQSERLQTTVDCNNVVIGSHARLSNIPCKNG